MRDRLLPFIVKLRFLLPILTLQAALSAQFSESPGPALKPPAPVHDVFKYGAKGDGKSNDRDALQRAIDACKGSGGSVYLHDGKFLTGQITLASDMTLFIAPSATLLGVQSTNQTDYPSKSAATVSRINNACQRRLIWGEGLKNIVITGGGTLDGQGDFGPWRSRGAKVPESLRPSLIEFSQSAGVAVSNLTLLRPGTWTQVYLECRSLVLSQLTVDTGNLPSNRDGMDICDCHNVLIADCRIKAQDDGICFKSGNEFGCQDIVVRRCLVDKMGVSAGNGIKFGTASYGSFRNILCEDLVVRNTGNTAFTWESVDGAAIENVVVRDCIVSNAAQVISVILGERSSSTAGLEKRTGSISNVVFKNIAAWTGLGHIACFVSGAPENPARDIEFSGLDFRFPGGLTAMPASPAEYRGEYPEGTRFGDLPAYAFYLRHAQGVTFTNCRITTEQPEIRPWLATNDARNLLCRNLQGVASPPP